MTKFSANAHLLEAAQNGRVPYAVLKDTAAQAARSVPDLLDELSYFVASKYFADEMNFEQANIVMNALWAVCVSEEFWADYDRTIPDLTQTVFLAFDAGEFYRDSDPPGTDPEVKYTKPLIATFLAEYDRTASNDSHLSGGNDPVMQ